MAVNLGLPSQQGLSKNSYACTYNLIYIVINVKLCLPPRSTLMQYLKQCGKTKSPSLSLQPFTAQRLASVQYLLNKVNKNRQETTLLIILGRNTFVQFPRKWHRLKPMYGYTLLLSGTQCQILFSQTSQEEIIYFPHFVLSGLRGSQWLLILGSQGCRRLHLLTSFSEQRRIFP